MRGPRTVVIAIICVAVALAMYGSYGIFVRRSSATVSHTVIVPRGATFHGIADQLAAKGLIESEFLFRLYAKLKRADTDVHAGEFRFQPAQTEAAILAQLQSGGAQVAKWVTFPEGFTAKQVAQRLQADGFGDAMVFDATFMRRSPPKRRRLFGTRAWSSMRARCPTITHRRRSQGRWENLLGVIPSESALGLQ